MPGANCSMYGCGTSRKHKDIGIFKLPLPKDDFHRKWRQELIDIILRYRVLDENLERQIQEDRIHICQRHFREDQFYIYPSRKLLKEGALPTLNLVPSHMNKMVTSGRRKLSTSPNTFSTYIPTNDRVSSESTPSDEIPETSRTSPSKLWTERYSKGTKRTRQPGPPPLKLIHGEEDYINRPPPLEKIQDEKLYSESENMRVNVNSEEFQYRKQSEGGTLKEFYSRRSSETFSPRPDMPLLIQDTIAIPREETWRYGPHHTTTTTTTTQTNTIATSHYTPYPSYSRGASKGRGDRHFKHYETLNHTHRTKPYNRCDHTRTHLHDHDHIEIHHEDYSRNVKRPHLDKQIYEGNSSNTYKRSASIANGSQYRYTSPRHSSSATNSFHRGKDPYTKRRMEDHCALEDDDVIVPRNFYGSNSNVEEDQYQLDTRTHHDFVDVISVEESKQKKNHHKNSEPRPMSPVYSYLYEP
ncbi:uncharacterized protein [Clytia hemisphaerica]